MALICFLESGLVSLLIYAAACLPLALVYRSWRRQTTARAFKERYGCEDPPKYSHSDRFWGSDLVHERQNAMKEGRYFKLYMTHFEHYGRTFEENARGQRLINTIEPANMQHVLAAATEDYEKDPARVKAQSPFMGPSVFSDGAIWKHSRAMVKPTFARAELSDIDHLASFTDRFLELIPTDGSMVDVQPLLHRLFIDVSTDFLFGEPLNALQPNFPSESAKFLQDFTRALKWVTKRRESGWTYFRYDWDRDWIDAYTKVHRFVDRQVARALKETQNANGPTDSDPQPNQQRKRHVLLHELARQIRSPIDLRYQILGVFLPARDTTSIAVSNTLFQLARHPEYWAKLRATSLPLIDQPLSFEKLKSLTDFRHIVQETIRLVGPAARVVRAAVRDTVLPVGGGKDGKSPVFVPKGTTVSMGTWCVQHDRAIWGEDVWEFRPERWVGRKTYWEFVPFSGGPRVCPAMQQVYTHTIYILVRLTQRFERMENRDEVKEYVERFNMVFESRNGVKVAFR